MTTCPARGCGSARRYRPSPCPRKNPLGDDSTCSSKARTIAGAVVDDAMEDEEGAQAKRLELMKAPFVACVAAAERSAGVDDDVGVE